MNYNFPEIRTIDDVLPHIEGREEFIVAERDFGTVVNYVVAMQDTFEMYPNGFNNGRLQQYDYGGAVRRECRGIKFYRDGTIAARPFHKWFNVGEREETQIHAIDMNVPHTIEEKLDGSMIHPMFVDGYVRWMTKMGITSVSMQAEEFIAKNTKYKEFATWCLSNGLTPIFEWCSPFNQIVVPYEKDQLTLLAVRETISGKYVSIR